MGRNAAAGSQNGRRAEHGNLGGAVVTGGGRGLGREIALRLARAGFTVHVTDVHEQLAADVAAEINAEIPRPTLTAAFASVLDVRDDAACLAIATATVDRVGSLALWVNNAGVFMTGPVWEPHEQQRRLMFEVNAHGTINGSLAALSVMRPVGRGHVINVASLAGLAGIPGEGVYAASKHAVLGFSTSALFDLRAAGVRGIDISCVCPDGIWTPMLFDKLDDPDASLSFSGKLLQPGEVADQVLRVVKKPRPVTTLPGWRGAQVRLLGLLPGVGARIAPLLVKISRKQQSAVARRLRRAGTAQP